MRQLTILCVSIVFLTGMYAAGADESVDRPKYDIGQRQNEDWSILAGLDPTASGDWFERVKYLPLDEAGDVWIGFGGHARARFEVWNNFGFSNANDDEFLLTRVLLHADAHIGPNIRVFAEGISAFATERDLPGGRRVLDADELDLQQLFMDVTIPMGDAGALTVRPGRQTLKFGKQRLVSPLPWANAMRSWDGISLTWKHNACSVTGFYTHFVPVQKYAFDDSTDNVQFFGVYANGRVGDTGLHADAYWLGLSREMATFNGTTGEEDRHTLGARLYGPIGESGFDFDVEAAYQFGEVGPGDISAYMIASELGYAFTAVEGRPRVWIGFDHASGDDSAGGDVETFNQLFPLGHAYYGSIDVVGRQNATDLSVGASAKPIDALLVKVVGHYIWRADESDALYNAGGGVVRAGAAGTSRDVGIEIDLSVQYNFDRHWSLQVGYSHFFAGDSLQDTGPDDDIDFVYTQLQVIF